jgi:tripartite-type tricarboxylate transporter receptor subunit TctC
VAAPERVAALPDVPTFKEVGLEPVNRMAFYGLIGPKGMPKDVLDKLLTASLKVANSKEFAEFASKMGLVMDVRDAKGMDQEMIDYHKTFSDLIEFMNKKE